MSAWLKSTIPGIIVLGAIGSILAYYILRLASAIGKRIVKPMLESVIFSNVRPFSEAALLTLGFANTNRWAQMVCYATFVFVEFAANFILFGLSLIATIVVLVHFGIDPPGLPITLVAITGFLLILLVRSFAALAGVYTVLFFRDRSAAMAALRDRRAVLNVIEMVFANQAGTSQSAAGDASAAAREAPEPPQSSGGSEVASVAHSVPQDQPNSEKQ